MNILFAFVPFLSFAFLQKNLGTQGGLLAAAAVAALLLVRGALIQRKSVKILEIGSLILFGAMAVAAHFPQFDLSVIGVRLWVDVGLLAIVAGSIAAGRPFTMQYAMERASPEVVATPRFKTTNMRLSSVWALAFVVIVLADLAMLYVPHFTPLAGTIVILAALGGAAWYTKQLQRAVVAARA